MRDRGPKLVCALRSCGGEIRKCERYISYTRNVERTWPSGTTEVLESEIQDVYHLKCERKLADAIQNRREPEPTMNYGDPR